MKNALAALAGVALLATTIATATPAFAGSGSAGGTTVSWDDSKMYLPGRFDCNELLFNYTNDETVNFGTISILNAFGTTLGTDMLSGASGNSAVQVCGREDFTGPMVLRIKSSQKFQFGGADQIVDVPFSFNRQSQFVRCIKRSNFKQKRYTGKWAQQDKCPKGWVKVTI